MNTRALKILSRVAGGLDESDVKTLKGVYSDGDPPLPIPNREVKPVSADGTASRWESRSMPNLEERASSSDSPFFIFFRFRSWRTCNLLTCNLRLAEGNLSDFW